MYEGSNLNASIIANLINTCSNIYNSESDVNNLSNDFWDICGCYLPESVYNEAAGETDSLTYANRQCWYVPCLNSSILPSINPKCPNNDTINCIQKEYITTKNVNTGQSTTQEIIKKCNSSAIEKELTSNVNEELTTSDIMEEFTFTKTKGTKKFWNILLLIIIIALLLIKCFWKK